MESPTNWKKPVWRTGQEKSDLGVRAVIRREARWSQSQLQVHSERGGGALWSRASVKTPRLPEVKTHPPKAKASASLSLPAKVKLHQRH